MFFCYKGLQVYATKDHENYTMGQTTVLYCMNSCLLETHFAMYLKNFKQFKHLSWLHECFIVPFRRVHKSFILTELEKIRHLIFMILLIFKIENHVKNINFFDFHIDLGKCSLWCTDTTLGWKHWMNWARFIHILYWDKVQYHSTTVIWAELFI